MVGKSGSGKSTVVDLLRGLQNPDSGNIEVDQDNLKNLDIQTFREKTSIISQDVFLFNASSYENLIWANPKASATEIKTALNLSNSMEFIDKLENGVNPLGWERRVTFSGGHKQTRSSARGIFIKPI